MKPLQKTIAVIGLVFAGAALVIWGTSQGMSDTKVTAAQMTTPGCAPSEELAALQQKAISGDATALESLKSKAGGNDPCAQHMLGYFYRDQKHYNEAKAAQWIEKAVSGYKVAAEKSNPEAQYQLGIYYWLVKRNFDEALKWWRASAEIGHPSAQYKLGEHYAFSSDVNEDKRKDNEKEGIEWLLRAANQGHAQAMFGLGSYYDGNTERKPDYQEAAKWYLKSAERNFTPAQKALSGVYALGEGLDQSWPNAYFWGCVAVRCFEESSQVYHGTHFGSQREMIGPLDGEKNLSGDEIKALKIRASEWKPVSIPQ